MVLRTSVSQALYKRGWQVDGKFGGLCKRKMRFVMEVKGRTPIGGTAAELELRWPGALLFQPGQVDYGLGWMDPAQTQVPKGQAASRTEYK